MVTSKTLADIVLGRRLALAAIMAVLLGACTTEDEVIVSAAASLTNAFSELGRAYELKYPGTKVIMNFGGSGSLLRQIETGAPVDVFASADEETMDTAQGRKLIDAATRVDFALNTLVLVASADSKLDIGKLADLQTEEVGRIAISNPETVPVGRYARRALQDDGLWEALESKYINTQHVRQSLDYVARGEVDVGFVYATDAAVMADKVRILARIPIATPIRYPIAVVADSRASDKAKHFIEFVKSDKGQAILRRYGFD